MIDKSSSDIQYFSQNIGLEISLEFSNEDLNENSSYSFGKNKNNLTHHLQLFILSSINVFK